MEMYLQNSIDMPITETKKAVVSKWLRGARKCIDIRWYVKYHGDPEFHRTSKGFFIDEHNFVRDLLPLIADQMGYVLVEKIKSVNE